MWSVLLGIYIVGPWKVSQFKMATTASLKIPELLILNNFCCVCHKCDLSIHEVLGQDCRVLRQSFVIWEPYSLVGRLNVTAKESN